MPATPRLLSRPGASLRGLLAAGCFSLLAGVPAHAGLVFSGGGDANLPTYFSTQVYSGFHNPGGGPTSFAIDEGTIYGSNSGPAGLVQDRSVATHDGATRYANSWSVASGFFATRNHAQLTVTNAQADDGYYAVAGSGSRTSVRFFGAPDAVSSTYRWRVSGFSSTPVGVGTSRLDFRARQGSGGSWFDLFDPTFPNFGPGDYSFTLGGDFSQAFDLLFWSSAYVQVALGAAPQGSSFTTTTDFGSTYVLDGIDLFDAAGNLLSDWTMVDESTGLTVFDANGRIDALDPRPDIPPIDPLDPRTAVPAPGSLLTAALGLLLLGRTRRRVVARHGLAPA